jgi:acyl-CoA synthetase (AMP-forming)/AMP-acid ligase II
MTNLVTDVASTVENNPEATAIRYQETALSYEEFCLERLAEYKHPREVEFVEELPRTTTGKVQKFELRGEEVTQ